MNIIRTDGQILRSRGIGAGVGALIGAGWMAFGLAQMPDLARIPIALVGIAAVVLVLLGSFKLITIGRRTPPPDPTARTASRHVWKLFWLNFVVEIVLLNVAVNLLAAPTLRVYWIPAISLVVGMHFLPMAWFLDAPSYYLCGLAMLVVAALAAMAVYVHVASPPTAVIAWEAVGNAVILWLTGMWAIRSAPKSSAVPRAT